jgi:hypothetical protein
MDSLDEDISAELASKEIEFMDLLETYISKSKQGVKLTDKEIETINALETVINELRTQYSTVSKILEPRSTIYDFDTPEYWDDFEEAEMDEIKSIIKRLKLHIKIPNEEFFKKKYGLVKVQIKRSYKEQPDEEYLYKIKFDEEYSKFMNKMAPYLPAYVTTMNVTNIGTTTQLSDEKSIFVKVKEDAEEFKKLPIQLSEQDLSEIEILSEIKYKLMNLEKSELIDCIENSKIETVSSYIEDLRNKKIALLKYQPVYTTTAKEPKNINSLLSSLLVSLGYSAEELKTKSNQELENILNEKYSIPPSLYFNKKFKYDTLLLDKHGNTKNLTLKYSSGSPVIIGKMWPIPDTIKITNPRYYETYYPVVDSLYKKLKAEGSDISEIWILPYKYSNGKYILKKFLTFEEYLKEVKVLISNKMLNNNLELTKFVPLICITYEA